MKIFGFALIAFLGVSSDFGSISEESGVYPFSQIENQWAPELQSAIAPLIAASSSKNIVGLGEPVHGTHAFHPLRVAVTKALIQDQGFRAVGFEIPQAVVFEANNYVQTCQGDLKKALQHPFWGTWKDVAVVDLFQWLCAFNQKKPQDPVMVFGFDNQAGRLDRDLLFKKFQMDLSICLLTNDSSDQGKERSKNCLLKLSEIRNELAKLPEQELETFWIRQALNNFESLQKQFSTFNLTDLAEMKQSMLTRDTQMAKNVDEIRTRFSEQSKTILYAHNEHLAKNMNEWGPEIIAHESMGTLLDRQHPGEYLMVGGMGHQIEIDQTFFPGWVWQSSTMPESIELYLFQKNVPFAVINARGKFLRFGEKPFKMFQGPDESLFIPARHYDFFLYAAQSGPQKN